MTSVDIVLSVHNGQPFLAEQLRSLTEQTHSDWRLWTRDDGSTDASGAELRAAAAADPRIRVVEGPISRLGASRSFGLLLEQLGGDTRYVMLCDADDRWLPRKIEITLQAMLASERRWPETPLLLHTDLIVADRELRLVAPSLREYEGVEVEPATFQRILVQNVVTGPTVMFNRGVLERSTPVPEEARYQDWWVALVGAAFGRVESIPEATVLYRQHGGNSVGAQPTGGRMRRILNAYTGGRLRSELVRSARQAGAFLTIHGHALRPADREFARRFAGLPDESMLRRKFTYLRTAGRHTAWFRAIERSLRA